MKTILLSILFIMPYLLFGQGIKFEEISFDDALLKAKKENKMVLLDAYTAWCAPCKEMAQNVFPQQKAGDYFNDRFICIKIDMEKEKELAKKLNITSYPTFIIFKSDGSTLTRFSGGYGVDGFIAQVEQGMNQKLSYGEMNQKFERGEMQGVEAVEYIKTLVYGGERERGIEITNKLLAKLSDTEKISKTYWPLYEDKRMTHRKSETFAYLVRNMDAFRNVVGAAEVNQKIYQVYFDYLITLTAGNMANPPYDEATILEIEKNTAQLGGKLTEIIQAQCNFARAREQKDANKMINELAKYVDVLEGIQLWTQTSAFLKVGGLNAVTDKEKLKAVGRVMMEKADKQDKSLYRGYYKLWD